MTLDERQIGYSLPINDEDDDEDDEEYIDFERSAFDAFVEIEDDEEAENRSVASIMFH